jgi:hypothetical protein
VSIRSRLNRLLAALPDRCPNEPKGRIVLKEKIRSPASNPPAEVPPCPRCGRTHVRAVVIVRPERKG